MKSTKDWEFESSRGRKTFFFLDLSKTRSAIF